MTNDFNLIKDRFYQDIILKLFKMRKKFIDRDNTIDAIFPYENFEEYFDNFQDTMKKSGAINLLSFSNSDNLFISVFSQYILNQLTIFKKNMANIDTEFQFTDFVKEQVANNIEELKSIILESYPNTYRNIEQLNSNSIFFELNKKPN